MKNKTQSNYRPFLLASSLAVMFVITYQITFKGLLNTWLTNDDYSYGILIPFISFYLLWDNREILKEINFSTSWFILPFLIVFVLISLYGVLGSSEHVAFLCIPTLIILFTGFCFGISAVKKLWIPLFYTYFMIPLPTFLDRTFGVWLKSISSILGGGFIRLCGFPVLVSGNVIDLGVTQLQVVDACSGLRFVYPLLAIGVLYSLFFERILWKRLLCIFSTIPIAILTNGLRIGITGVLTNLFGPEAAQGFFHDFSGWVIFMVAFIFLFVLGRILKFFFPDHLPENNQKRSVASSKVESYALNHNINIGFGVSSIILLVVALLTYNTSKMPPIHLKGGMAGFPRTINNYTGISKTVEKDIIDASGAEDAFNASYLNNSGDDVSLYIGYRSTAFLENENFFHTPKVCLPASGWKTLEITTHKIKNVPKFNNLTVIKMKMENAGHNLLVYYWFQTKEKTTHNKQLNRFHLALHALKKDNTYDLFIRTITTVKKDENIKVAEQRLDSFIIDMMPVLNKFLNEHQITED